MSQQDLSFLSDTILSLCMIVRNEAKNLPRCLASVKPYVDEIIVVDTGSTDETVEIARSYGAKVSCFEWCDDFAAARNYAISQATGEWILILDADEELIVDADSILEQVRVNEEAIAYYIPLTEASNQSLTPSYLIRLVRNLPEIKYTSRYHEYLTYQDRSFSENQLGVIHTTKLLHYGYSSEQLHLKNLTRNIPILEHIRQEEGLSLMLLYCLGGMYADTEQPEKAEDCYEEALERLTPNLLEGTLPDEVTFIPSLLFILGVRSLEQQDYETARIITQRGISWFPNYPPLLYLTGTTIKAVGFPLGAIPYFETCIQLGQDGSYYKNEPFEISYLTTYPAYDLGCIYLTLQQYQQALAAFELALSFDANFTAAQEKIDMIRPYIAT